MTLLKDLPIAQKVGLVTLCTSTVTLLILSSAYFSFNWTQYKQQQFARLESIAGITASATEAALMFDDKAAATESVFWLQHEKDLEMAVLFDSQKHHFASFHRGSADDTEVYDWQKVSQQSDGLSLLKPIFSGPLQLGAIYLQSNQSMLQHYFVRSLLTACFLFLGGLAITVWLSSLLCRAITAPISDLAKLAEEVSHARDYGKKAKKVYDDEVGSLVDSFNCMLERIKQRDETIQKSHQHLEAQVRERTAELEEANARLLIESESAQAASRAKSDFLSVMSHEIRTPMNAIVGMTSLMAEDRETNTHRETIEIIQKSSDALLSLVDNILDYSKIEAGHTELEQVAFSLHDVVVNPLIVVAAQHEDLRINYLADCSPELPATLIGDPTRLRQIVTNLLSNAVKFTEQGHVRLDVDCDRSVVPPRLNIHVSDTGIGIPADRHDRLFKHFSQVDASTTRRFGGTGLGLAISQRLANAMGGEITLVSTEGSGSTFTMQLPLNEVEAGGRIFDSIEIEEGARVKLIGFQEPELGVMIRLCESIGLELFDPCSQGNQTAAIPVVFGDLLEPAAVGDLLATHGSDVALDRALVLCRQKYAAKMRAALGCRTINLPVIPNAFATLFQVVGQSVDSEPCASPTQLQQPAHGQPLSILLVEDNVVNQMVFTQMLKRENFRIDVAVDGIEAVNAVGNRDYDMIFMDYMMPKMNGLEAIRAIRSDPSNRKRPFIVALTANAEKQVGEDLIEAGAQIYLAKPVRKEGLLEAIKVYLNARQEGIDDVEPESLAAGT